MKIALAQLNYHIGHFDGNLAKMLTAVGQARQKGADIIVFGELATCGYPPRDFLEFDDFIDRAEQDVSALAAAAKGIAIVVGSPSRNPVPEGKNLHNSAYFLAEGMVQYIHHKSLLPTYDIFDEYRYFEPMRDFQVVEYKGKRIALTVCEDIWDIPVEGMDESLFDPLYDVVPMDEMKHQSPDLMINVSASPFHYEQAATRIRIVQANARRYQLPVFYCNHVGAQTELIFDGGSLVVAPDGRVYDEMPYFEEGLQVYDLDEVCYSQRSREQPKDKIDLIHRALLTGLRDYFAKLGFSKAILGLSGGIDSAVTAVLAAQALGKDNVRVLLLPSPFSSDHSVNDARELAVRMGIQYDVLPISTTFEAFNDQLKPHFWGRDFGLTEENIQARIRGTLLMAFSNQFGNILLNTTNKSEMAVGYGTLYGDLAGGLSVIGDVYKTEVYELARYLNDRATATGHTPPIPENTITKPPSAELRPDQKDSDSLPEYDELDPILYDYIEQRMDPQDIIARGHDEDIVRRVLRLVNINEFKRHQTAPVLRVSRKAFGMGRRLPIVAKYLS